MLKIISILMVSCIMILGVNGVVFVSANETTATPPSIPTTGDVWDGTTLQPSTLTQKDGVYYYEITKCSELAYVAENGGEWLSYNYILGNNLILNDVILMFDDDYNCINTELLQWTPINNFTGIFEGNNYNISGLFISDFGSDVGLFGKLSGRETIIRNLLLVNSYVCASSYAGGIVGELYANTIENCVFDGVVKINECCAGGITGSGYAGWGQVVKDCINYGTIIADRLAGGIGGHDLRIENCINYGDVNYSDVSAGSYSGECIGGVGGDVSSIKACKNFGKISGLSKVGGIAGESYMINSCINYGDVKGESYVAGVGNVTYSEIGKEIVYSGNYGEVVATENYSGGIIAYGKGVSIRECFNCGVINGKSYSGGIAGYSDYSIYDCYNVGDVSAETYAAGIVGHGESVNFENCYSIGNVSSSGFSGALLVSSDAIWGDTSVADSYYLKDDTSNTNIFGCGNSGLSTELNGISALSSNELKNKETYKNWNYDYVWNISGNKNNGYPYLVWQNDDSLTSIPISTISINPTNLKILVGKTTYLSTRISPINATNKTILWSSSDDSVAKVDANGKVIGISSGIATITVTSADGKHSDSCVVTVEGTAWQEYQINSITIKDPSGNELTSIPKSNFLATISITSISSGSDTIVVLSKYSDKGAFEGLMYISAEDLPIGSTIKLTLPIDNKNGDIAKLKAFSWASFNSLTPMGNFVSFPAE